jgi:hypothetical protein
MGILADRDLGSTSAVSEELLMSSFAKVGIPINIIPISALMRDNCSIADVCSHPAVRGASEGDIHLLLHFLAAPDWCFKYWIDNRHRMVWGECDICVYLRDLTARGWDDANVDKMIESFTKRAWHSMCRSDVLALTVAANMMTDHQRAAFKAPVLESISHTIRGSVESLFTDETLAELRDMIMSAHAAGLLDLADIQGHLDSACLAFVLLSCGRHALTTHEGTCGGPHKLLAWLPTYICTQPWREAWCDTVYGTMEPGKIITTYLDVWYGPECIREFSEAWLQCVDAAFYKLWYMMHRMLHAYFHPQGTVPCPRCKPIVP